MVEDDIPIPVGEKPTDEDRFYLQWGRETIKNNIALVNDILKHLTTLNTALIGGSIVFIDQGVMHQGAKVAVIVIFFVALFISFLGLLPYQSNFSPKNISAIKNHKRKALTYKCRVLNSSAIGYIWCPPPRR